MADGLAKWRPALLLGGGSLVVVGIFVAFGRESPPPSPTPSPPPPAADVAQAPADVALPPPPSPTSTALVPPLAPSTSVVVAAPSAPPSAADSLPTAPPVPGGSVYTSPPTKPITPDWEASQTQKALAAVQVRATRIEGEIAELEKAGKTQEAAEKKILLKRLQTQMSEMKADIAQYQIDAGALDATAPK